MDKKYIDTVSNLLFSTYSDSFNHKELVWQSIGEGSNFCYHKYCQQCEAKIEILTQTEWFLYLFVPF